MASAELLTLPSEGVPSERAQGFHSRKPLPRLRYKHQIIVTYYLCGETVPDIAQALNMSVVGVYNVLRRDDVIIYRQQLLESYQDNLDNLIIDVHKALKSTLSSTDEKIQLDAVDKWIKVTGKDKSNKSSFSAEDMVVNILNQSLPEAKKE